MMLGGVIFYTYIVFSSTISVLGEHKQKENQHLVLISYIKIKNPSDNFGSCDNTLCHQIALKVVETLICLSLNANLM